VSQPKVTNRARIGCLVVIFFVPLIALVLRTGYWMLIKAQFLQEKAQDQWTRMSVVEATRGTITDSNGTVLASSSACYSVVLLPRQLEEYQTLENKKAVKEERAAVDLEALLVQELSTALDIDPEAISTRLVNKKKYEVWLKRQITDEQAEAIEAMLDPDRENRVYGVKLAEDTRRYYPMGNFLSQVLGFVSIDGVGQQGIEARFNKYLSGTDGHTLLTTDVSGREVPSNVDEYVPAQDGSNVQLTVDAVLQGILDQQAEQCLNEQKAAKVTAIMMEASTGRVLGMSNKPDYDNNSPPRSDATLLAQLSRNTAISDNYEPGSTFKIITTAAALELGAATKNSTYTCTGELLVDGEHIKCWSSRPHGTQDLTTALENSCNPAFMRMALEMGVDGFYQKIYDFGFGSQTGIQLTGEASGLVRSQKYIRNVDLARIGFGQSIAVTPLQLVTAVSAAVNGGHLMKPMLVDQITDGDGNIIVRYDPTEVRQVVSEQVSAQMRTMLQAVVDNGSGKNGAVEGYAIGGKTGTAQKYGEDGAILRDKHVSSFVAFAPADDPEIVVLFVVDEPGGSSEYGSIVAAPYVAKVMEQALGYLNVPKAGETTPEPATDLIEVPSVAGQSSDEAIAALQENGFNVLVEGVRGNVTTQIPKAGEAAARGSTVVIGLEYADDANEANAITLPDLTGKTPVEAYLTLQQLGLRVRIQGMGGVIAKQEPKANTQVFYGDTITLELSQQTVAAQPSQPATGENTTTTTTTTAAAEP
jgi:stage V sporulation protein D (sporulation-specific penicillin-binding protein)